MEKINKYKESDWEDIASYLSGESRARNEIVNDFLDNEGREIEKYWTMIDNNRREDKVDVDQAWNKLFSRLKEDELIDKKEVRKPLWTQALRIAAVVMLVVSTAVTIRFLLNDNTGSDINAVATTITEKNRLVELPDGSIITLNRSSELTYPDSFDNDTRKVELRGEAFFDIKPDPSKPFIVDAGNAQVKVLGTSFNVITSNEDNETEVFVESGKVMLCYPDGDCKLTLEPGYIGTTNKSEALKRLNDNPNYMSWNTDVLVYDGDRLEQVFHDLKRTHNIDIEVLSESILDHRITTEFKNNSPEVIIRSICTSFNLSFEKKEGIYYLSK